MALKVSDVIFKPSSVVIYFNDRTVVEGFHRVSNNTFKIDGFTAAQRTAVIDFYENAGPSSEVDVRFHALIVALRAEENGGGGGPIVDVTGGDQFTEDEFTPTNGQTVFTLTETYVTGGLATFYVNGIAYRRDTDYTISGTTLTWLDGPFTLSSSDEVFVVYQSI